MGEKALDGAHYDDLWKSLHMPSFHVCWPFGDLGCVIRSPRRRPIRSLGDHQFSWPMVMGQCHGQIDHSQGYIARVENRARPRSQQNYTQVTPVVPGVPCARQGVAPSWSYEDWRMFAWSRFLLCLFLPILCHGKKHLRDRRSLRPHLENHMSSVSMVI